MILNGPIPILRNDPRQAFLNTLSDVMTRKIRSLEPDASVSRRFHLMPQNRISGLPAIDATGKLAGF
jgi:CBS domain-containing protein